MGGTMLIKRFVVSAAVIAAAALSGPASAGYFGLSIGQTTLEDWDASAIDDGSLSNTDAEDSDVGFRVMGGMDLTPNFAVELGYSDFGEATAEGDSDGSGLFWPAGPVEATVGLSGIDLALVGKMPVSPSFAIFAKFGMLKWELDVDVDTSAGSGSDSDDGNDTFFGVGGEFNATESLAFRGDYTLYGIDDEDMNTLMFSLIYRAK